MTSSTPHTAEEWRKQGNRMYQSVSNYTNLDDIMTSLKQSIYCYNMSRRHSASKSETASAFKNLAVANMKLAIATPVAVEKWKYFKDSLRHFDEAFTRGETCKEPVWVNDLLQNSHSCLEKMFEFLQATTVNVFVMAEEFAHMILAKNIKAECFYGIANMHFQFGIAAIALHNYSECLNQMKECYFPLNEAARVGAGILDIQEKVDKLQEDVNRHTRLAKAMDSREKGDNLFKNIVENHLENTEMVWEVIDKYKYSIWMFQDLDIKEEAITQSRLGQFCDQVLMIPLEAKEYFKRAIELAQSLRPMDVTNEDWFQCCIQTLKTYQKQSLWQEEEEAKKRNESILNELAGELNELKATENEPYNIFLAWLYNKFPPRNPANKLDLVQKDNEDDFQVKYRCLRSAINHYHPDLVDEAVFGLKVKVLHLEITKQLTRRYELAKAEKLQ